MKRIYAVLLTLAVLASLFACAPAVDTASANALFSAAEKYLLDLEYEQAVITFDEAIQIDPKDPRGMGIVDALLHEKRPEDAVQYVKDHQNRNPKVTLPAPSVPATLVDLSAGGEPGNRLYDLLERLKEAILRSVIDGLLALADYFRQVNLGNQAFQLLRRTANEYPGEARVKAALAKLAAVMPEAKVFYAEKWESTLTTLPAPPVAPATTLPPTTKSEADLLREMRTRLVKYVQNYAKTLGYYAAEGSGATSVGILTIDRPYDAREEEQCKKKIREEALYKLHETLDCRPDELTVYVKTGTKADQIMVYCSVKAPTTAKPATKAAAKPASKIEFSKIMYDPIDTLAQKLECVYVGKDDFGGMEYENKSTGTSLYGQMRPEWDHPIAYSCNWTTPTISFYGISVGDLLKSSIKKLPISDTQSDLEFYAGEMTEEGNYHFYSGGSNSHLLVADQDGIITEISMRYYIPGAQD